MLPGAACEVVFKGKWHLTRPAAWVRDPERGIDQRSWSPVDVDQISEGSGSDGWTMPEAGDNRAIENMGGGDVRNDQRFTDGHGRAAKHGDLPYEVLEPQGVTHFLRTWKGERPLCLIVSLVNPHDVLADPGTAEVDGVPLYPAAGYRDEPFGDLPIDRPPTWDERLSTEPRAQRSFRLLANAGNGPIGPENEDAQLDERRFCAYLCRHVDRQIRQLLDGLRESPLQDDTFLVRVSDHGDMAMAHGLQGQKLFNICEETLNVPFGIAHTRAGELPGGSTSNALFSLIDLPPTIATLAGVPDRDRWSFKCRDLRPDLSDPRAEVHEVLHFTYDDLDFSVPAAGHLRAIVEKRWKYAVCFDPHTDAPFEYEMYDLEVPRDEREVVDLGHPETEVPDAVAAERERLDRRLIRVMETVGTLPLGVEWPARWGEQPSAWSSETTEVVAPAAPAA